MTLSKILLIGGVATTVTIAGWGAYLAWDNFKDQDTLGETVLGGSQLLLEEMRDPKTKASLLASCDKPQTFANKLAILEAKIELLNEGKEAMIEAENAPPILPDLVEESMKAGKEKQEKMLDDMRNEIQDEMHNLPKINGDPSDAAVEKAAKEYEEYRNLPGLGGGPSIAEHEAMVEEFRQAKLKEGDILSVPELLPEAGDILFVPELPPETNDNIELPLPGTEGEIPPLPELGDRSDVDKIESYEKDLALELAKLKTTCDNYVKKEAPVVISNRCEDACKKYSQCAGFTEGATVTDQQDAYDGCMEECAKWADSTKICINTKPIKAAMDCMNLSVCAMKEYNGGVK